MTAPTTLEPAGDVEVVLSPEAVAQAGIKTAEVTAAEPRTSIQVPGTVMANAYREVKVVPVVGGIVTKVQVELGTSVKRGAPLATLFSVELAEAQTKYLAMKAMLTADHQTLERTKQLVEIGAASRQEQEEALAASTSRATEVEAAQQRLLLLGLSRKQVEALRSPNQIVSDIVVPAPMSGVITSGGHQVVFVAVPDQEGTFVQRTVKLGPLAGESYTVLQGLEPGAVVVTEGSFFLRAESLRNAPAS